MNLTPFIVALVACTLAGILMGIKLTLYISTHLINDGKLVFMNKGNWIGREDLAAILNIYEREANKKEERK